MRPIGSTKVDSSVSGEVISGTISMAESRDGAAGGGEGRGSTVEIEMEDDVYGNAGGDGQARVSTECFARLSPSTIVYMSAFVSSLTSVLLGYGEIHLAHNS